MRSVLAELEAAGLVTLADKGYQGSTYAKIPYKGKNKPDSQKQASRVPQSPPDVQHARSRSARSRLGRVRAQRVAVCRAHADVSRRPPRPGGPFVR
jgi:hypothetical protein